MRSALVCVLALGLLAVVALAASAQPAAATPAYFVRVPRVKVVQAACPQTAMTDVVACADFETNAIYVTPKCDRICLAHEYGHFFDRMYLTDDQRTRWAAMLHRSLSDWYWTPEQEQSYGFFDQPPVEETFADAYALCAIGQKVRDRDYRSNSGRNFIGSYGLIPRQAVASTCWLASQH